MAFDAFDVMATRGCGCFWCHSLKNQWTIVLRSYANASSCDCPTCRQVRTTKSFVEAMKAYNAAGVDAAAVARRLA